MVSFLFALVLILSAYLMGSVCSAVIIAQLAHLPDPRLEGSKNPGATNMLRLAGKKYAILVLVVDALKGMIPVVVASWLGVSTWVLGCMCLAAVLGHVYPLFFHFKGGKGVATALGVLLGFQPWLGLLTLLVWLLIATISRYSSLASLTAIGLAPFLTLCCTSTRPAFFMLLIMAVVVIYQHRENIHRLRMGSEPKIKLKSGDPS